MRCLSFSLAAVLCLSLLTYNANAAILLNEITMNSENDAPSGGDEGTEYFEILSTVGAESLSGLTFLVIEGDGSAAGTIDQALSLSGFSTGTNGLFLWRDTSAVLLPAPEAATVVNVADFSPDIENGSGTFAIVSGFTGSVGDDLDADNDGVFDAALPWASVLDAVSNRDSSSDAAYAAQMIPGATEFPGISFAPDSLVRLANTGQWIGVDIDEDNSGFPGPYPFDDTQSVFSDGTAFTPSTALTFNFRTPGGANPSLIPEPASLTLLCVCGMMVLNGRRYQG